MPIGLISMGSPRTCTCNRNSQAEKNYTTTTSKEVMDSTELLTEVTTMSHTN